ncbi:hypothetical protein [Rathayibacter rathayi]|uniref:hypothetical protein n=1 Tax=Rathayibacter rathayi TaxID=33887 RepID=UPI0011B02A2F|nr:hypothetical protein [Rathayibacter rathayi]
MLSITGSGGASCSKSREGPRTASVTPFPTPAPRHRGRTRSRSFSAPTPTAGPRTHRSCVVLGIITLVTDLPRPAYRTVRLDPASGDRILLRDTAALEEAFAVLLAGLERSRIAAAAPSADAASASAAIDRPLEFEDAA